MTSLLGVYGVVASSQIFSEYLFTFCLLPQQFDEFFRIVSKNVDDNNKTNPVFSPLSMAGGLIMDVLKNFMLRYFYNEY